MGSANRVLARAQTPQPSAQFGSDGGGGFWGHVSETTFDSAGAIWAKQNWGAPETFRRHGVRQPFAPPAIHPVIIKEVPSHFMKGEHGVQSGSLH